jgi:hypothetical protein
VSSTYASLKVSLKVGSKGACDKLEVIWFSIITTIWKARNAMIFIITNVNWEKAAEDSDFIFEDFEIKIDMF